MGLDHALNEFLAAAKERLRDATLETKLPEPVSGWDGDAYTWIWTGPSGPADFWWDVLLQIQPSIDEPGMARLTLIERGSGSLGAWGKERWSFQVPVNAEAAITAALPAELQAAWDEAQARTEEPRAHGDIRAESLERLRTTIAS